MKNRIKSFTLIELMIVITILSILAAIIVPNMGSFQEDSRKVAIITNEHSIQVAIDMYRMDNDSYPTDVQPTKELPQAIDFEKLFPKYLKNIPEVPNIYYWVDLNGKVWSSMVDAPLNIQYDDIAKTVAWNSVDNAESYNVFKAEEISLGGMLNYEGFNYTLITTIVKEEGKTSYNITVPESGTYLVTALDKYKFESAPVGVGYSGFPESKLTWGQKAKVCNAVGYICINTKEELATIGIDTARPLDGKYRLNNDIDLTGYSDADGKGWKPIGSSTTPFTGTFEGNTYKITGLAINRPTDINVGLFSATQNATLEQIKLEQVSINGNDHVAGITGLGLNTSINKSYVKGDIIGQSRNIGGIAGELQTSEVYSSYFSGTIQGTENTGGLVGRDWNSNISDSYVLATVSGTNDVGGLIGYDEDANIQDSYFIGDTSGVLCTGGLVGRIYQGTVTNSYSQGTITNTNIDSGGLIGLATEVTISNSHSTSSVNGISRVGGLIGYTVNSNVGNSFATGQVQGTTSSVGGLIGSTDNGQVTSSRATGSVNTNNTGGGLIGKTVGTTVTNVYATGNVTCPLGSGYDCGGLIGYSDNSTINKTYSIGNISGNQNIGGLIGSTINVTTVSNSFTVGQVNGNEDIGGVIGDAKQTTITNIYGANTVTASIAVGGLVGWNGGSSITDSYWNTETSGLNNSSGAGDTSLDTGSFGKTTIQMKQQATYNTWDFITIWNITEGTSYPTLK